MKKKVVSSQENPKVVLGGEASTGFIADELKPIVYIFQKCTYLGRLKTEKYWRREKMPKVEREV